MEACGTSRGKVDTARAMYGWGEAAYRGAFGPENSRFGQHGRIEAGATGAGASNKEMGEVIAADEQAWADRFSCRTGGDL